MSDRLRQIKEFERKQSESLESAILRLTLLLDKTETLFPNIGMLSFKENLNQGNIPRNLVVFGLIEFYRNFIRGLETYFCNGKPMRQGVIFYSVG